MTNTSLKTHYTCASQIEVEWLKSFDEWMFWINEARHESINDWMKIKVKGWEVIGMQKDIVIVSFARCERSMWQTYQPTNGLTWPFIVLRGWEREKTSPTGQQSRATLHKTTQLYNFMIHNFILHTTYYKVILHNMLNT